jgi:hypothetical protein
MWESRFRGRVEQHVSLRASGSIIAPAEVPIGRRKEQVLGGQ